MAKRQRVWDQLADSTRTRYLRSGRKQGLTDAQIKQHYEGGGSVAAWRGHRKRPGASERQWGALVAAAKAARLNEDVDNYDVVLESLLAKGYKPDWILQKLAEKQDSRDTFRSKSARDARKRNKPRGWDPGRRRFHKRDQAADIEIYWYH